MNKEIFCQNYISFLKFFLIIVLQRKKSRWQKFGKQSWKQLPFVADNFKGCFWKLVNKASSFHSCLSTFQKSKSDINLLLKYWHFWSFLPSGDFFKKIWLCHTQLHMGPQHHAKFQKKLMTQFWENLQTDGRIDEHKYKWKDPILQDPSDHGWVSKNDTEVTTIYHQI